MLSEDKIMNMSNEEFAEKWKNGEIHDSVYKLLGAREMTDEDRKDLDEK